MKLLSIILPLVFLLTACSHREEHGHKHHGGHHRFQDAEKWSKVFEQKERDEWQRPLHVLEVLNLKTDDSVADIGSATGYFPVRIAQHTRGNVYGIDIEPNLVDYLNKRAKDEGLTNLTSILAKPNDPMIPEKVDLVMTVDTYHHINNRIEYFKKVKKQLKENGRLAIIDFKIGEFPVGPPNKMKIKASQVTEEIEAAGYKLLQKNEELPYQYILIFGL